MAKTKIPAPAAVVEAAPDSATAPTAQVPAPDAGAQTDKALPDVVDTPASAPVVEALDAAALPELVKARVLAASSYGQPNDVIEIDAALAKTLPDVVDTSPEAVAYAESLAGQQ